MANHDRSAIGLTFRVMEPSAAERVVDGGIRVLAWPLAVVGLLTGDPIDPRSGGAPHEVVVVNARGKWRSLGVEDSLEEALAARDEEVEKAVRLRTGEWRHQMRGRIPASFFD